LARCVNSGQVFRWERLSDGCWLGVDGSHWYRVELGESELHVTSNATPQDFKSLFRLDWNAADIESKLLAAAPELGTCVAALDGLRLMKPSGSTEVFFSFLCTPNNNLTRIVQMCRHLATYGPELATVDGRILHRFPTVEVIAAIPESALRAKAFGYRAATIPSIANQVLERGEGWIESLKSTPYAVVHSELCKLKGIGPKLADCIALFALNHTEAIPVDTHIWQAYTRLYRPDQKNKALTDARYREASEFMRARFGRYGGWAQQYLFYENMLSWRERANKVIVCQP